MRRLNGSDDRWICIETEQNTFQIGALILLEADEGHSVEDFEARVRDHFRSRLPATPLPVRLETPPWHFDTGVWLTVDDLDLDRQVHSVAGESPMGRVEVNELVSRQVLVPWDRHLAPFQATLLGELRPDVADEEVARPLLGMVLQTHHSVADGVGFQAIVEDLTDPLADLPSPPTPWVREASPNPVAWVARSAWRFGLDAVRGARRRSDRRRAATELAEFRARPEARRVRTAEIPGMAADSSSERAYERMTMSLSGTRAIGKALGGTVNDALMTVVSGALRRLLADRGVLDALADQPLVALVPRSTRSESDGRYGNHLTMMLPQLATNVPDPLRRFELIHDSMRAEITRSQLSERAHSTTEGAFAAARRRRTAETGTAAGNVSISNVPGPAEPRYLAGYRMVANYPVPNVVEGQFLNITLRRYGDALHLGLMTDVAMMGEPGPLVPLISAEFELLSDLAR